MRKTKNSTVSLCDPLHGPFFLHLSSINGRLLFDYLLHKVSVTEKVVADLLQQVLAGLDYMHQHTVYHLDIRVGAWCGG